ncbi:hypothetical protein U14_01259 [Candidatus Moduliflexus flocculans]|uniref:Uncharacterized protein n=1 Tax=Candidatus Moduliflexus flocculans TaxID=1499966 RepID=A0A0S6VRZ8_9BACT|nr:hypothetical protein U14_01259 [Candidatus Moduliflexus flocculans]
MTQRVRKRTIGRRLFQKVGSHGQHAGNLPIGLLPRLRNVTRLDDDIKKTPADFFGAAHRVKLLELVNREEQASLRVTVENGFDGFRQRQRCVQQVGCRFLAFFSAFEFVHIRLLQRIERIRQLIERMLSRTE